MSALGVDPSWWSRLHGVSVRCAEGVAEGDTDDRFIVGTEPDWTRVLGPDEYLGPRGL